ncbi:Eco57I restriction-modification methylase domain-containing protein [Haloquadratum walsbyi]|uniref:site-specific DNA-methyltransferase (adenine-specific) n=1 Tax=Haloquadratum walsbyi (strain DSM 16790 / HBSQ001) TaxID=362976 RepID=Q18F86_HALWD|nr:N-6 DNA methylase [Haloquadratum walsbyi]CAJ53372.1 probable restriction/modification enzyme [Haloquadratum walsbyi DSM 16790]
MSSQTTQTDTDMGENRIPQTSSTTFITTSGGLLTEQLASKLRQRQTEQSAVRPETFMMPGGDAPSESELENEIGDAWSTLRERWDELTMSNELFGMSVSDARNKWILQLFRELGFEPVFQRENLEAGGIDANLSHKGWPDGEIGDYGEMQGRTAPILHTVEPGQQIDQKPEGASRGTKSPHDTLQEFLNASDAHDWAVVTNGLTLRILRDYYHTYTRGYIEFDLENMFTNRNYGDFRALYRLCHATRFIEPVITDEEDVEIPLEQLYQIALSTGIKIGQSLQSNVVSAIETLGTGLLNQEIRGYLQEGGEDEAKEYYQEVLSLVYRLLFLLYAEQRGMMASRESLYTEEYSVTSLREKAETRRDGSDRNTDLWHGLQSTFRLVEEGNDELGVPCYNGMLFDSGNLELVSESECSNDDLLDAIEDLTLVEYEGTRQRISYADLGVEEIGSVYESLLEFTPRLATEAIELEDRKVSNGQFYLDDRGTERKETGSYYTDPGLVQELVQSALKPVVEDRLEDADTATEKEDALLDISVCDPASGSGAFLIAANNFLGQRLARIRSGGNYPPEDQIREARRDVLQHCIYAVDLNPMAVELAKVSLWINSAVEDKPLNFLDHHIKCGNSLIGTNSELIEGEFPVDAYETSGGRDWHVGNEIRKRIRSENRERAKGSSESSLREWGIGREYVDIAEQIEEIEEQGAEDIRKKKQLYDELRESDAYQQEKLAYDVWTAAFYWPMDGSADEYPSPSTIDKIRRSSPPDNERFRNLKERVTQIARQQRFFHWELEFPEIFADSKDGFDCILGNPPWEKVKAEQKEWFAGKREDIASSTSKTYRTKQINQLQEENPDLYQAWKQEKRNSESASKFIRESGRYPLSGTGDINTYPVFTELCGIEILDDIGRSGIVIKTGIATDYYTQNLFSELVSENRLVSLYDFVNKRNLFPDVATRERFCLLTMTGSGNKVPEFEFSFFNWTLDELHEKESKYRLSASDIQKINPNTNNCPVFQTKRDRDITISLYSRHPTLINDVEERNPWGITYHTMVHMTDDSSIFSDNTLEKLKTEEHEPNNLGIIETDNKKFYPLLEAKLFNQYDHRFSTFEGIPKEKRLGRRAGTNKPTPEQKSDTDYEILPRYWVNEPDFQEQLSNLNWDREWIFSFRNVGGAASNSRTAIGTVLPMYPCGNSAPVLTFEEGNLGDKSVLFTTIFNSFVFDFALQQSLGGANFNYFILKQLPMPTPESLQQTQIEIKERVNSLREFLLRRGVELIWTSHSLDPLGESISSINVNGPFEWDSDRRRQLRAEVDAAVAKAYDISREDFEYILNSFEILKDLEQEEYGEYKRKKECLEAFDRLKIRF